LTECVMTQIRAIWMLVTLYKPVYLHVRLLTECFLQTLQAQGRWSLCLSSCLFMADF